MLPQTLNVSIPGTKVGPVPVSASQFGTITGYAGLVVSEYTYGRDQEIYGEDEAAEYVYQVTSGAVRTYRLLSDGRRQIGAFHLPGDMFGLETSTTHRLTAEAIVDTTVRLVKRRSLEQAAGANVKVARSLWTVTAAELNHAEGHMLLLCSDERPPWNASRPSYWKWIADLQRPKSWRFRCAAATSAITSASPWRRFPARSPSSRRKVCSASRARGRSCCATVSACAVWMPSSQR